jgi:hypothetical protein
VNSVWLAVSLIAAALLSWLRLIVPDGDLARAEPKTLRRILHAAGKLVRGGRRRLKIRASWPWAEAIATAWARITALPYAPLTSEKPQLRLRACLRTCLPSAGQIWIFRGGSGVSLM